MNELALQHLQRLEYATVSKLGRADLVKWLEKYTTINSLTYSTKDHEYQARIMSDESQEIVTRKCSQVGMSEMSIRMALALVGVMENYDLIYTFPSATFAAKYVKTRVDPVIVGSSYLRSATTGGDAVDSSEVKKVGSNFLYFNGAAANNAAISVAADGLIHDELDFSDQTIISQYQSRLTHSPHKHKWLLSTPTVPDGPIDTAFKASRRHWNIVKCDKCGYHFVPDYYKHVVVPGWDSGLEDINRNNIAFTRYKEAKLLCPKCGREPSLQVQHRMWVCENPNDNFIAAGYQVQPFDAPNLISIPFLVEASTKYERRADFVNFNLGLPERDNTSGLQADYLERAAFEASEEDMKTFPIHFIGADMGLTCHIMVGAVGPAGELVVVNTLKCSHTEVVAKLQELRAKYRSVVEVVDTMPYVETVYRAQESMPSLFGALFTGSKGLDMYRVRRRDGNDDTGVMTLRQVDINKGRALDKIMDSIQNLEIVFRKNEEWESVKKQMCSMQRTALAMRDGEMGTQWIKTDGNDHYHHALLYVWVASQLRYMANNSAPMTIFPGVTTRRVRTL